MKHTYLLIAGLLSFFLICLSCGEKDESSPEETKEIREIKGLAEKGPFESGSVITIYELDQNLKTTGHFVEGVTNGEGAFSLDLPSNWTSKYVKLSVTGICFNEYTGTSSTTPISLDAIVSLQDIKTQTSNVNILTHLETPRVLKLVSQGKDFKTAKEQAIKELLKAFLITDVSFSPENTSITSGNTSADILIAISAILINKKSEVEVFEFINSLRNDLEKDEISDLTKNKIAESSFGLIYTKIVDNLKKKYRELGKTIEIGKIALYIDGNGDGKIGEIYDIDEPPIDPKTIFDTEEDTKNYFSRSLANLLFTNQYQYLFDGVYTNTVNYNGDINLYQELKLLGEHNPNPGINFIRSFWAEGYRSIYSNNLFLTASNESVWSKKYNKYAKVLRAYAYLKMVDVWGDLPLVTSTEISFGIKRTSKSEIINFIINELNETYQYLPSDYNDTECSKYLAMALLARTYLLKKDYTQALECANNIINSGKFALSADRNSIHTGGSVENIFELSNTTDFANDIKGLYAKFVKKGDYTALVRYSEILLIASETNFRLGNNTQAAHYLNLVRQRNGKTNVNMSSFEEDLLTEWKDDLINEGCYFSALKRFEKAQQVLGIEDYKLLLPIPGSEVNTNPLMTQNPGY